MRKKEAPLIPSECAGDPKPTRDVQYDAILLVFIALVFSILVPIELYFGFEIIRNLVPWLQPVASLVWEIN